MATMIASVTVDVNNRGRQCVTRAPPQHTNVLRPVLPTLTFRLLQAKLKITPYEYKLPHYPLLKPNNYYLDKLSRLYNFPLRTH